MITPQQQTQVDAIKAKYNYKPPQAQGQTDWLAATAPKPPSSTFGSVGKAVGQDFNKRADEVGGILDSNQNPLSKGLQVLGKGAAVVGDAVGEVVKSAIKPELQQKVGETLAPLIEKAKTSPAGQGVINWWANLEESHPELAKNLEATGNIALLLSNAVGGGAGVKGTQVGIKAAEDTIPGAVAGATKAAEGAIQGVKDTASTVKTAITPAKKNFYDLYTSQAQGSKALSKALEKTTVTQDGVDISPITTIEGYDAVPKVVPKNGGGHGLDFSDIKAEAEMKSKALTQQIDARAAEITTKVPTQNVLDEALTAVAADNGLKRTGDLPGVRVALKQLFKDYGIEGDTLSATELNEFRKGANEIANGYYEAQKTAGVAGVIPKAVSDRAEAAVILGRIFKDQLASLDDTLKPTLAEQATHINAARYASAANLSSIGVSAQTRAMIDAAGAAAGSVVGALSPIPGGSIGGAAVGAGLTDKAQSFLLKKTYEGAEKMGQSTPATLKATPAADSTTLIDKFKDTVKTMKIEGQKGFIKNPLAPQVSNIHPDDLALMHKFIDHARIKEPLSETEFAEAEKLAEKFNISMDKGLAGVANDFEKVLSGDIKTPDTVVQARNDMGQFAKK